MEMSECNDVAIKPYSEHPISTTCGPALCIAISIRVISNERGIVVAIDEANRLPRRKIVNNSSLARSVCYSRGDSSRIGVRQVFSVAPVVRWRVITV